MFKSSHLRAVASSPSALIFHIQDLHIRDLPLPDPNRLNVYLSQESPYYTNPNYKKLPSDFFNLTMTYRKDSHVFWPYDKFEQITADTEPSEIWSEEKVLQALKRKKKTGFICGLSVLDPFQEGVLC